MELRLSLDVIVLGEGNTFLNLRNKGVLCVFVCAQSCLTLRDPHGPWPARLLCPWNFPDKNTEAACHFLL